MSSEITGPEKGEIEPVKNPATALRDEANANAEELARVAVDAALDESVPLDKRGRQAMSVIKATSLQVEVGLVSTIRTPADVNAYIQARGLTGLKELGDAFGVDTKTL